MNWTSVVAIYVLFWVACAFILLPFGVKTHEELGIEKVPGQADSAPANFQPRKIVVRATVLSAVLTALWVANHVNGWVTPATFGIVTAN
ncbi:hypothetical protein A6F68_02222 [Tsuneonella dongtanensis]|uniref:Uncharacterized protein n=1 Tax=Tsuneonella dongtanensis TaxID=692370 RepID=A0A1B2AEY8_9SPHN|nr:DUF1467 family protein [Tsuneonella dongtanensis]ANY20722.1 hypothetical protein A6F68_02222 [Tsuneonella dongtanensis]